MSAASHRQHHLRDSPILLNVRLVAQTATAFPCRSHLGMRGSRRRGHLRCGLLLQLITESCASVCVAGALGGDRGSVAADHLARAPARQHHQILFLASVRQPVVGEEVPKLMGMQVVDPRFDGSPFEHLLNTRRGHLALAAQP